MKDKVLYFCEHTATRGENTGIQKVSRFLAKILLNNNIWLIPVRLKNGSLEILTPSEIEAFALHGGPKYSDWGIDFNQKNIIEDVQYAIVPDLIQGHVIENTIDFCKNNNIKIYSIFYDAIPALIDGMYPEEWKHRHINYMKKINEGAGVMAISQSSYNEYTKIVSGSKNAKAILLPNQFIEGVGLPEKINPSKKINIIYVSSIEGRKNHKTLIDALKIALNELSPQGYQLQLSIVGRGGSYWLPYVKIIEDACKMMPIKWYNEASDEQILELLGASDFSVYPSIHEGFGLPVIESLFNNTPCIVANNTSLKEVGSLGGCLFFDTYSVEDLAKQIVDMATKPNLRHALVEEIKDIPKYSWDDYANKILDFMGVKK